MSEWSEAHKWGAKKRNIPKRVNAYTNPAIMEVIYADEWKLQRRPSNKSVNEWWKFW